MRRLKELVGKGSDSVFLLCLVWRGATRLLLLVAILTLAQTLTTRSALALTPTMRAVKVEPSANQITIAGVVRDFDGTPVMGASVTYSGAGLGGGGNTDINGLYSFSVNAGTYTISVYKYGYPTTPDQTVTVPPSRNDVNFTFPQRYSISGIVRNYDGSPVADVVVTYSSNGLAFRNRSSDNVIVTDTALYHISMTKDNVGHHTDTAAALANRTASGIAFTDANGYYSFTVSAGSYQVSIYKSGYAAPAEQTVTVPPARNDINFTVQQCTTSNTATTAACYHWNGATSLSFPVAFDVTGNGAKWSNFTLTTYAVFGGCSGTLTVTVLGPSDITNNQFSSSGGSFSTAGEFSNHNAASGTFQFTNLYIPNCGYFSQSGTWTATGILPDTTPPTITVQPANQTIVNGQSATLSVTAIDHTTLNYQWYRGNHSDTNQPINGATANIYTTAPLTTTTSFWVRVTNAQGVSTDSATATLTVVPQSPSILRQPASQTIISGQNGTLSVAASGGEPLTYQWYQGNSGDTSAPINSTTSSNFTAAALTTNSNFWVRVTNTQGGSADSATATITVVRYFTVSAPFSRSAGGDVSVNVIAKDSMNQVATGYRGTVSFTSTDSQANLPGNYTFNSSDNGAHTFSVVFNTPGSQDLTVSDTTNNTVKGSASLTIHGQSAPQSVYLPIITKE